MKPFPRTSCRLTTIYEHSLVIVGPKVWNLLPPELTLTSTFDCFKIGLDRYILTIPDYPPLEGYPFQNSNSICNSQKLYFSINKNPFRYFFLKPVQNTCLPFIRGRCYKIYIYIYIHIYSV